MPTRGEVVMPTRGEVTGVDVNKQTTPSSRPPRLLAKAVLPDLGIGPRFGDFTVLTGKIF